MKKLTIAAAAAAMSAATFAAVPEAQVYDVALTIKTTKAVSATVNNKTNPFVAGPILYRAQTSVTWKGLIWGCDCESIDGVWENAKDLENCDEGCTVKGCVIWDVKGKVPVYFGQGADMTQDDKGNFEKLEETIPGAGFGWAFLQCIGKDGKSLECAWDISANGTMCGEEVNFFDFRGAGFGKAKLVTEKGDDDVYSVLCNSYVSSLSGNFAGWMRAPTKESSSSWGCSFCGKGYAYSCDFADAWAWCKWDDWCDTCEATVFDVNPSDVGFEDLEYTAAYGTWSIKYNATISKKLTKAFSIRDAYNFKSLPRVEDAIEIAEKGANTFRLALLNAKAGVVSATETLANANQTLADAEDDAVTKAAAIVVANANADAAKKQYAAAQLVYEAELNYRWEAYDIYKATYVAQYGAWNGKVTRDRDWTNSIDAAAAVVDAQDAYQFVVTNDIPAAELGVDAAKAGLKSAEDAVVAAKEDIEECQKLGACDYCED